MNNLGLAAHRDENFLRPLCTHGQFNVLNNITYKSLIIKQLDFYILGLFLVLDLIVEIIQNSYCVDFIFVTTVTIVIKYLYWILSSLQQDSIPVCTNHWRLVLNSFMSWRD